MASADDVEARARRYAAAYAERFGRPPAGYLVGPGDYPSRTATPDPPPAGDTDHDRADRRAAADRTAADHYRTARDPWR